MEAAGILPSYKGTLVHDGWRPYRNQGTLHALCNAHHLRELQGLEERGQKWPIATRKVLLEAYQKKQAKNGKPFPSRELSALTRTYRHALDQGRLEIQRSAKDPVGKRKSKNLLRRLTKYESDVLRFAYNPQVPFTNNQAERDIRMVKLQQKISGGWRTERGIKAFLVLRSYLSTLQKNGVNPLRGLELAIAGTPWLPKTA